MHPVQAAPRQSWLSWSVTAMSLDAPRAGSAEAKFRILVHPHSEWMHPVQAAPRQSCNHKWDDTPGQRCTPCRQRRGKVLRHTERRRQREGCTPCRQRRGKALRKNICARIQRMHPVQAAPRQSSEVPEPATAQPAMHPVQAAPRQRRKSLVAKAGTLDAPRAGSAEAKHFLHCRAQIPHDAPRAGSAEAKCSVCKSACGVR